MSELGPLSFGKKEEQIFLGREIAQHRDYSEETAIRIDEQVRGLVDEQYRRARRSSKTTASAEANRRSAAGARDPGRRRSAPLDQGIEPHEIVLRRRRRLTPIRTRST